MILSTTAMNEIRIIARGSWLCVRGAENYLDKLASLATYTYKRYFHSSWPASQKVKLIEMKCYKIDSDEKGKYFICKTGLMNRILSLFHKQGVAVTIDDDFDKSRPVFTVDQNFLNQINFRPRQRECIEKIINSRSGLVKAATGLGKSFIIAVLCTAWKQAKIDVIARSKEVIRQIQSECAKYDLDPGVVGGGRYDKRRVTIYTAASLHKSDFNADIVLADECHELVTPKCLKYLYQYKKARMFGFSATIDTRADNAHFHLYEIFGDIIFDVNFSDAVESNLIVQIAVQWHLVENGPALMPNCSPIMLKKLAIWRNDYRNKKIADVAKNYYDSGKQVLIMVETVEHAIRLKRFLPEFIVCAADMDITLYKTYRKAKYEVDVDEIIQTIKQRDELQNQFKSRKVLGAIATNIWSAGVSFDDLEVLIRADARISKTINVQAPGRVCRVAKTIAKPVGIVVDFYDKFDPRLERRSRSRFQQYKSLGWIQCNPSWKVIKRLSDF